MTLAQTILTRTTVAGSTIALALGAASFAQDPQAGAANEPGWIRGDIEAGYALAQATGKPLLVAFR